MKSVWSASQSRRLLGALVAVGPAVLFIAGLTAGLNTSSANNQGRYDPTHGNNEEQGVTNTTQVKESNDGMWTFNTVGIPNTGSNGLPLFHPSVTTGFEEQGNDGTLKREVNTPHYNGSKAGDYTTVSSYSQSTIKNTTITLPRYSQSTGVDAIRYLAQHEHSTVIGPMTRLSQTGHQPGVTTRANVQHSNPGTVGTETSGDLVTPAQPTTSSPYFCTTNETDGAYVSNNVHFFTTADFLECQEVTFIGESKCSNQYFRITVSIYEKDSLIGFTQDRKRHGGSCQ